MYLEILYFKPLPNQQTCFLLQQACLRDPSRNPYIYEDHGCQSLSSSAYFIRRCIRSTRTDPVLLRLAGLKNLFLTEES